MPPDEPSPVEPSPAVPGGIVSADPGVDPTEQAAAHRDEGLDLARALARDTARAGGRTPRGPGRGRRTTSAAGRRPRPGEGGGSGPGPGDRDPQLLDAAVGRLVADQGWEVDLRVHGLFGRWAELVGAEVAQHSAPESFSDGTLLVRTDSTAWATQLRLLAPTVVRRLNEQLGHGTVGAIQVRGPQAPSWRKGPRSVRDGRGPRDTYG